MTVKTRIVDEDLVEHLEFQGKLTPVRKYWLDDHWEFRFRQICQQRLELSSDDAQHLDLGPRPQHGPGQHNSDFQGDVGEGGLQEGRRGNQPFSAEEVQVILDACLLARSMRRGAQLAAAAALQAFCGLRSPESCVLNWADIDLVAGLIRLKANGSKVRCNRTIKLPENAKAWLQLPFGAVRRLIR